LISPAESSSNGAIHLTEVARAFAEFPAALSISGLLLFLLSIHYVGSLVDIDSPEGLLLDLPLIFWIGLALVLLSAILVSEDHHNRGGIDAQRFVVLCVYITFLYGVKVFFLTNDRDLGAYYPLSQVVLILSRGGFDILTPPLNSYFAWPGANIIAAFLLSTSGMRLDWLIKYGPMCWAMLFILISYAVGKSYGLTENRSFLFSMLMASSFWLIQSDLQATALSYLLLLVIFMLHGKARGFSRDLTVTVLLCTLVIFHPLTAFFAVLVLILLVAQSREWPFAVLGVTMFLTWNAMNNVLVLGQSFEIVRASLVHVLSIDFSYVRRGHVGQPSLDSMIMAMFWYLYLLIYGVSALAAFFSIIRRRTKGSPGRLTTFWIIWILAAGSLLSIAYGGEILQRAYVFALPAAALCTVAMCPSRRGLIMIVLITTGCFFPAAYLGPTQVPTSELQGTKFFSLHADATKYYFYENWFTWFLIAYNNPEIAPYAVNNALQLSANNLENMTTLEQSRDLGQLYVMRSTQTHYYRLYYFGRDRVEQWLEEKTVGTSLLYNNGYFEIYW
jgi:hypothetical protein